MYIEKKKKLKINWLGLLLKIILLILLILAIYFIYRGISYKGFFTKDLTDEEFNYNINNMKDKASDYFNDNLPNKVGNSKTLTLKQMIDNKLINDFTKNGKLCSLNESYVKVTKKTESNYSLKVYLSCNNKNDYLESSLVLKKSTKEDKEINETTEETKQTITEDQTSSSSSSSSIASSSVTKVSTTTVTKWTVYSECPNCCQNDHCDPTPTPTPKTVTYYKHVKYSDWTTNVLSGENIETKIVDEKFNDVCPINKTKTYYASAIMSHHTLYNSTHIYNLMIADLNGLNITNYKINYSSYFTSNSDYQAFLNQKYKPTFIIGDTVYGSVCLNTLNSFKTASLTQNNFTYTLGNIYKSNNKYYLPINITYKNAYGVNPVCNCSTNEQVFFLPIKFNISYTENTVCVKTIKVTYYRSYVYKWSTNIYEEGYTYTGISEERIIG